jgi:hypothetical protein
MKHIKIEDVEEVYKYIKEHPSATLKECITKFCVSIDPETKVIYRKFEDYRGLEQEIVFWMHNFDYDELMDNKEECVNFEYILPDSICIGQNVNFKNFNEFIQGSDVIEDNQEMIKLIQKHNLILCDYPEPINNTLEYIDEIRLELRNEEEFYSRVVTFDNGRYKLRDEIKFPYPTLEITFDHINYGVLLKTTEISKRYERELKKIIPNIFIYFDVYKA